MVGGAPSRRRRPQSLMRKVEPVIAGQTCLDAQTSADVALTDPSLWFDRLPEAGRPRATDFDLAVPRPPGLEIEAIEGSIWYIEEALSADGFVDLYLKQARALSALVRMFGTRVLLASSNYEKHRHGQTAQRGFPDLCRRGAPYPARPPLASGTARSTDVPGSQSRRASRSPSTDAGPARPLPVSAC